jgi:PAS domain S-box-containing protein
MERNTSPYFIVAVAVILAAGLAFTYVTAGVKDSEMRDTILTETRLASTGIMTRNIQALSGSEADLSSPYYRELKAQMALIRSAKPSCRFAYILQERPDGTVIISVDSEDPSSPDYSPPGQVYNEVPGQAKEAFRTGYGITAGPYPDRWGSWVSGYVPLHDPATGKITGIFGMDTNAKEWNLEIAIACVTPVMTMLVLLVVVILFFSLHERNERERRILKDSEAVLQDSERRLSQIIDFLPDATFAIDRAGRVIAWNRAIEEMTGVAAADIIGKGDYEYALPFYGKRRPILIDLVYKPEEEVRKNYTYVSIGGTTITGETVGASPLGKDVVLWGRASALRDAQGTVIGAIESIRDVTERRSLQDSLDRTNRKMHLLSSITRHDILNKVTVCLGFTALIRRETDNPAAQDHLLRLEKAINEIRNQAAFTKLYQDIGIKAPVWQDIGGILAGCHPPGIAFSSDLGRVEVYADPMLPKVFANLTDNTARHGQKATKVTVRTQVTEDALSILFEDDGIGIPADEKEHIFERGFGKNTGLGLFLAREILGITGITIRETGEPGKGARFEITVPEGAFRII